MPDVDALLRAIRGRHRNRVFAMETRKAIDLRVSSFVRRELGWSRRLSDAERKAIATESDRLITTCEHTVKQAIKAKMNLQDHPWQEDVGHLLALIICPTVVARAPFDRIEARATKEMEALAEQLPVWAWAAPIRGFSARFLATIVAETGDLSTYSSPAKVWKRMGLAVLDGVRQGGLSKSASKEAWIEHGYSRVRRSYMYVIGDTLIKNNQDGRYRTYYLERLRVEHAKALAAGLIPVSTTKNTVDNWAARDLPALTKVTKLDSKLHRGAGHMAKRAQRYMEKRLLRDLWQAWRETIVNTLPNGAVSPAATPPSRTIEDVQTEVELSLAAAP